MAFKFICSNEGLKPQGQFQTKLLQINYSLVDGFLICSKIVSCLLARGVNMQKGMDKKSSEAKNSSQNY